MRTATTSDGRIGAVRRAGTKERVSVKAVSLRMNRCYRR